jgi:hypothetical protein
MRTHLSFIKISTVVCVCVCIGIGCVSFHRSFVRQTIPITVQEGKPVVVKLQVRNDSNEVGIRCSPALWHDLTNSATKTKVHLKASTKPGTEISDIYPGMLTRRPDYEGGGLGPWGMAAKIPDVQYLFVLAGKHPATATIEIDFPTGPREPMPAEIIVMWEPWDMGI